MINRSLTAETPAYSLFFFKQLYHPII